MFLSNFAVCGSEKLKFSKDQEACGLLSSLRIRTPPLSKISLVGPLLFLLYWQIITRCKMNQIVNKFLLAGDNFMHEMHLRQPAFMYYDCGPFTKIKKECKNSKKQEIHNIFIRMN